MDPSEAVENFCLYFPECLQPCLGVVYRTLLLVSFICIGLFHRSLRSSSKSLVSTFQSLLKRLVYTVKEPNINAKEPYITAKEAYITVREPWWALISNTEISVLRPVYLLPCKNLPTTPRSLLQVSFGVSCLSDGLL